MQRRGQGDDSPSRELRHFTDREDEQKLFHDLLATPAGSALPALMFFGVGGTGKTWLLRRLRESLGSPPKIPVALLDLDAQSGGARFRDEPSAALAEIRRQFDVDCPRFDLAYAMMRHRQGDGDEPLLKHSGKAGLAWEFVKEGGQVAVNSIPGANLAVWLIHKGGEFAASKFKDSPLGRRLTSQAGNQDYHDLLRLTAQEIAANLPRRLGEDLEEQLPDPGGSACRAVVFLDTFESLQVGVVGSAQQHAREEWVREIYRNLTNVLLVIAGRDRLDWGDHDPDWEEERYLQQHLLGGLSRHDAAGFLEKFAITGNLQDAVLRASIDEAATGQAHGETAYHPYSLGLNADSILNERKNGREPDPSTFRMAPGDFGALAMRFLKSLHDQAMEDWIIGLAQTARFDEPAARALFSPMSGPQQNAAWNDLEDYSFLQEASEAGSWFMLHSQMRDALRHRLASDPDGLHRVHRHWLEYWSARSADATDDAAGLAWFHRYRLDPPKALAAWNTLAEQARRHLQMTLHQRLLGWWAPIAIEAIKTPDPQTANAQICLGVELTKATQGNRTANLSRAIDCYESALRVYTEADLPLQWAMTQNNLGNAYADLPTGDRGANLSRAIDCYESALRVRTEADFPQDWAMTQNNLGTVYRNLPAGDRGANLSRAIDCYESALRVRTEEELPWDFGQTQWNLGLALREKGDDIASRAAFEAATRGFRAVGDEKLAANAEKYLEED